MICLIQLVINKAPSSMVALGLKIAVLDLSLILFIKSELLCRRFATLSNFKIFPMSGNNTFETSDFADLRFSF